MFFCTVMQCSFRCNAVVCYMGSAEHEVQRLQLALTMKTDQLNSLKWMSEENNYTPF